MAITTIIGLVFGFLLIAWAIGGTNFSLILPFLDFPSFLIVVGCSICALLTNYTFKEIVAGFMSVRYAFRRTPPSPDDVIALLVKTAVKARKEGFAGLASETTNGKYPLLDLGLGLMADGTAPELVQEILESKSDTQGDVLSKNERIWRDLSVYGPMFGMLGTLIGLVLMLRGLSDPTTIGPSMAIALVTTFYGIIIAGVLALPLAGKINNYSQRLALQRKLIILGLLSVQSGNNSRIVEEKLKAQVPVHEKH